MCIIEQNLGGNDYIGGHRTRRVVSLAREAPPGSNGFNLPGFFPLAAIPGARELACLPRQQNDQLIAYITY
jgi:hypothetical protein